MKISFLKKNLINKTMRVKKTLLNLRPEGRVNQSSEFDANVNTSDCEFALSKPIHFKQDGHFYLRSAYFPISYKNVIEGVNDRFAIVIRPTQSSTDDKSVFLTVQIPVGQYDTLSDLATAINTVLAETSDTSAFTQPTTLDIDGDVEFSYAASEQTGGGPYSQKLLSHAITCSVSTNARYLNHLKFTLPQNTAFHQSAVPKTKDGSALANANIDGGIQIVFGLQDNPKHAVENRTANKMLGFGHEAKFINGSGYHFFPNTPADTSSSVTPTNEQNLFAPEPGNTIYTPHVYVRCDLARQSIEVRNRTSRTTDLIGKIPLQSTSYGTVNYYEADNNPMEFQLPDSVIHNVRIVLTDFEGRRLEIGDNEWELNLVFEGVQE